MTATVEGQTVTHMRALDALTRQFRPVCEDAIDDLDVAVALEATGLNDAVAATRYGVSGVLELATELMRRVPTQVSNAAEHSTTAAPVAYIRLLGRGALYALPGLFYLVLAHISNASSATMYLITSMLCGWAISQLIAVVAYRMLTRTGPRNVSRMLRQVIIAAPVLAALVLIVATRLVPLTSVAIAVAQVLYVVAATVLLFHEADKWLALAILPSAGISALFLAHWPVHISTSIAVGGVAVAVPAVLIAAFFVSNPKRFSTPPDAVTTYQRPIRSEVAQAVPFAFYGLLSGLVVAYRPIWIVITKPHHLGAALDFTILPLVLSMGYAEIELLRLRSSGRSLMKSSKSIAEYHSGVRTLLIDTEVRFAGVVAGLSIPVLIGMHFVGGLSIDADVRVAAYLVAGCAFIAGLILNAVDEVGSALRAFGVAVGVVVVVALVLKQLGRLPDSDVAYLEICAVLFACLWWTVVRKLKIPLYLA